ncbi:DNA oxidative demethylase AlkB [uncultured Oxalicibacterium sp.]|uniref:DNA oxidative demethylase AlkB n=1 Tax=uncultured Oxalicibacterium sp. TaxID=1168540 RepID=UPI0025FC9692|nr:DNA oxidative demethylase AlkB [uncultured Oxalicibacterium sp.]
MNGNLFDDLPLSDTSEEIIADGAMILRNFATAQQQVLLDAIRDIADISPFRHLVTPGGFTMSVAMTNCGSLGWASDRRGYRYEAIDPLTNRPWPDMPASFLQLAGAAAARAGFLDFIPDACLINRYEIGARLSLHQDRDEPDRTQPIVSVSLGIPAMFHFGGMQRSDAVKRFPLGHGDVVVWGGNARLAYHAIAPLKSAHHPLTGSMRFNLTFRKAG